jgi:hypothetical protein
MAARRPRAISILIAGRNTLSLVAGPTGRAQAGTISVPGPSALSCRWCWRLVSRADFCATGAVELALGCSSSLVWLFFSGRATGRGSAGVPPLLPAATSSSLVCTTGCRSSVASATTESAAGFPCSPTCISSVVYRPARGGTGTWCSHCQLKSKALAVVGGTGFEPVLKLQALRLVIPSSGFASAAHRSV